MLTPSTKTPTKLLLLVGLIGLSFQFSFSQVLDKQISIELNDVPLKAALKEIGEAGDFSYSYNPTILPKQKKVSIDLDNGTVNEALTMALNNTNVEVKAIGEHIVLTQSNPKSQQIKPEANLRRAVTSSSPRYHYISGFFFDGKTNDPISDLSIRTNKSNEKKNTDQNGFFRIKAPQKTKIEYLEISHKDYRSQKIPIPSDKDTLVNIILFPLVVEPISPPQHQEATISPVNPLSQIALVKIMFDEEVLEEEPGPPNLKISPGQLSLVTPAGTHGLKAGKIINRISVNLLAGYSAGVKGLEIGGLLNSSRYKVEGVQIAGLANTAGGYVRGLQLAGVTNVGLGSNVGLQVAGVHNHADTIYGIQMAGAANMMSKKFIGLQLAGAMNVAEDGYGVQVAGAINVSTDTLRGVQASGFINLGKVVKGAQIGVFNFSDTLQGVAFGFFSYVKKGYHKLEVSSSDLVPLGVSFRTGNYKFYNIFSTGINPDPSNLVWAYGYGFGTTIPIRPKWRLHTEGIAYMLNSGQSITQIENLIPRFNFHLRYRTEKGRGFSIGPSVNVRILEDGQTGTLIDPIPPLPPIHETAIGTNANVRLWLGWKVGFEF